MNRNVDQNLLNQLLPKKKYIPEGKKRWTEEMAATCIKNHRFPGESSELEGAGSALCVFGSWAM